MKIQFKNTDYELVKDDFDLAEGIISLGYKEGGSFFTMIPISSYLFKNTSLIRPYVCYNELQYYHKFVITDDWGVEHIIKIPKNIINNYWLRKQITKLVAYNLMKKSIGRKILGELNE